MKRTTLIILLCFSIINNGVNSIKNNDTKISNFVPFVPPNLTNFLIQNHHILKLLMSSGSAECITASYELMAGIYQGKLWAFEFLDSNPQISMELSDLLDTHYGNFEECINISPDDKEISFRGKYCWGSLNVNYEKIYKLHSKIMLNMKKPRKEFDSAKVNKYENANGIKQGRMYFSFCLPESCELEIIQNILNKDVKDEYLFEDSLCFDNDIPPLLTIDILLITILTIWLLIIVISTFYDYFISYKKETRNNVLIAFSLKNNVEKIFKKDSTKNPLYFLHGLRVLSTWCVILGHRFVYFILIPVTNKEDQLNYVSSQEAVESFGLSYSVDTFLILSGLILTVQIGMKLKRGKPINIWILYLRRYVRLTVPLVALIIIHVSIMKYAFRIRQWPILKQFQETNCKRYWWSSLLYVQNYVNPTELCLGQTWYLSVDMQLYLVAPFLIVLLHYFLKGTIYNTIILIISSIIYSFYVCWTKEIKAYAHAADTGPNAIEFFNEYYVDTLCRMSPYLFGILTATAIDKIKPKFTSNKVLLLWTFSLICMGVSWLGFHDLITRQSPYDKLQHSAYNALSRPVWAAGICVLIFLCYHKRDGFFGKLMELPHFSILSRISYCVYLVHFDIEIYSTLKQVNQVRYEHFEIYRRTMSDTGISLIFGSILALLFELPAMNILDHLWPKNPKLIKKAITKEIKSEDKTISIRI